MRCRNPGLATETRYEPGVDSPLTFHVPGVPSPPADTVEVWNDTLPSVIDTVAAPTGPLALLTVPDSAPLPATRSTFSGSASARVAAFTMNRCVWYPARAKVSR